MSSKQRVYGHQPMATSRRRDINNIKSCSSINIKSNSGINKSNTTRTIQSKRQPLLDMENINPQHQKQQQKRLSKQIANSQRDKSYLYNVDKKSSSKLVVVEKRRAASKSQSRTATKSQSHTAAKSTTDNMEKRVNNNSNNNTSAKPINHNMPQVISFEEFKSIRRSGGALPTLPSSQSSTIMWSPTREHQSRGDENIGKQQKGRVGKQQGKEGKKREQQQQQQQIKEMTVQPMSFEQFKVMRRTGQLLPLVPSSSMDSGMSGNEKQQRQHGKGGPQIMSFEEFKEMKRLLRSSNNHEDSAPISKMSSRTADKRGMKKNSKKSRAKDVNSSSMKKDSSGSKKKISKSSNKLQAIPKEMKDTNQQQKKENKLPNRLLSRKTKKEAVKKKSLSISKEVNVQVQEEEKKVLSPIPEVITELTPTASSSSGIETVVGKEDNIKGDDDNVKMMSEVVEDQSIPDTSTTTFDIYSAMLYEAQPYLTGTTCTKSMKKEEVPTEEELIEAAVVKEERLPVDSVDSMDDNDEREDVIDEMVEEEVEKEVSPDISMVVCADEEKDRIGFDSSSSNPKKVDDMVGKDVTIPSLNEMSKPLVRTLDFDIDEGSDEVVILSDQPEILKSESDGSESKKGRILHIHTKRKINKGGIKKTMKKILPSFGRSKSNKAEQVAAATEHGEIITDVKIFVPSPKAVGMPVSPSAMSIISVELSVVDSNDRGTITDITPVTSGSPPHDLLYGAINYDFKNFDEHSDSHLDDSQPPAGIPVLNVESSDEEEDSKSIFVELIEQARISDNDNVATEVVAVAAACKEDTTKEINKIGDVTTNSVKQDTNQTYPERTFQKEVDTEEVNESILTESHDISYLDEYQQALLASYIHDIDAEDEEEEDVVEYLQAPDTTHSDQTSIAQSAIDSKAGDSSLPYEEVGKEEDTKEEEPATFSDINDEDEPEDELVVTTKLQKSTIKLSVETATPSPSAPYSVVSKKSSESGIQEREIPQKKSRTSTFPKSASKKCSNGLVKSRISDIQQRIDALSSTASSFDNHGRGTGRHSYSHPLPSPTCSVSSATSSISSRMSSSSYIRTVPIGIAKTYSRNLESPSGSVVGLGFGNDSTLDIDNNQWQDERATTVSYAQKYMK